MATSSGSFRSTPITTRRTRGRAAANGRRGLAESFLSLGAEGRLRAQNRGHYLDPGTGGQWKPLWRWRAHREERLRSVFSLSRIAFGEWCYAEHSTFSDPLPDWFRVLDIYDRE